MLGPLCRVLLGSTLGSPPYSKAKGPGAAHQTMHNELVVWLLGCLATGWRYQLASKNPLTHLFCLAQQKQLGELVNGKWGRIAL